MSDELNSRRHASKNHPEGGKRAVMAEPSPWNLRMLPPTAAVRLLGWDLATPY
jgi:hypothetical protein